MQVKRVYTFIKGRSDGTKDMKALLGGKGANLCEMARYGLNVPPGTVSSWPPRPLDLCSFWARCAFYSQLLLIAFV